MIWKYEKLVRDKIPEEIDNDGSGRKAITHVAEEDEYEKMLIGKLKEEFDEFMENRKTKELADIIEVSHAIAEFKGKDIEEIRKKKAEEKGRFENRLILDEIRE